jgi:hypothetical protein
MRVGGKRGRTALLQYLYAHIDLQHLSKRPKLHDHQPNTSIKRQSPPERVQQSLNKRARIGDHSESSLNVVTHEERKEGSPQVQVISNENDSKVANAVDVPLRKKIYRMRSSRFDTDDDELFPASEFKKGIQMERTTETDSAFKSKRHNKRSRSVLDGMDISLGCSELVIEDISVNEDDAADSTQVQDLSATSTQLPEDHGVDISVENDAQMAHVNQEFSTAMTPDTPLFHSASDGLISSPSVVYGVDFTSDWDIANEIEVEEVPMFNWPTPVPTLSAHLQLLANYLSQQKQVEDFIETTQPISDTLPLVDEPPAPTNAADHMNLTEFPKLSDALIQQTYYKSHLKDSIAHDDVISVICQFASDGYSVGQNVDVLIDGKFFSLAKVLAIRPSNVKVHYCGWSSDWDEWVHPDRLSEAFTHRTADEDINTQKWHDPMFIDLFINACIQAQEFDSKREARRYFLAAEGECLYERFCQELMPRTT